MSADFWAGYISGAAGILIGNPLDVLKVRLQGGQDGSGSSSSSSSSSGTRSAALPATGFARQFESYGALIRGTTAPILGYGALNALLFVTYNRTTAWLNADARSGGAASMQLPAVEPSLWSTWVAGALGGLATWVVSTPTELVKCRAQMPPVPVPAAMAAGQRPAASSVAIARAVWRSEGVRGFFVGGTVTALRDSIGYGFYFWSYALCTRLLSQYQLHDGTGDERRGVEEAAKVLLCGGIAGVVTWASVFPLDVIKTRVQTQRLSAESAPLLVSGDDSGADRPTRLRRKGAMEMARLVYRDEGFMAFWRGLGVCSVRAFIVNAAQWAVYEWIMRELTSEKTTEAM